VPRVDTPDVQKFALALAFEAIVELKSSLLLVLFAVNQGKT
jgi:hypothetical protein